MTEAARLARREYMQSYYKRNRETIRAKQAEYWERKAYSAKQRKAGDAIEQQAKRDSGRE